MWSLTPPFPFASTARPPPWQFFMRAFFFFFILDDGWPAGRDPFCVFGLFSTDNVFSLLEVPRPHQQAGHISCH